MNLSLPIWLATWTAGVSDQAAGALVTWLGGSQWQPVAGNFGTAGHLLEPGHTT